MKKLSFKSWVNEYYDPAGKGMGWRGLFRGTCGDKSCSRGSGKGWDPYLDTNAEAPDLEEIPSPPGGFGDNSKGYYNPQNKTVLLSINVSEILKDKNKNLLIKQLVQRFNQNISLIHSNYIINYITNKTQPQGLNNNSSEFKQLKYIKNYISQDSLVIVFKLL